MQVPLLKGDTVDDNVEYRDALMTNMFAINRKVLGAGGYVINYFGLSDFTTGEGIDRGCIWVSRDGLDNHYRVSGTNLIAVASDGTTVVLGTIPGSEQVSMAYSFNNLAIVADGNLYYYNLTDGFREITDPDIGSPIDIVWVDGYFFLTDGESIYHSNITDEELFEPLAFANAEFIPDPSQGLGKTEDNEVAVFGSFSTEYVVNVAGDPFAFQRITRKANKLGILGTHCKKELNGKWYVLGRRKETSPSFHIVSIGNEQSFSSRETDKILATYTVDELSTTTMDTFTIDNVTMIVFHLPNHTLCFNESLAATQGIEAAWTILKTDVLGDLTYRAKNMLLDPRSGKWLIGDKRDNHIGELDRSKATHYGEIAEWLMFTPFMKLESLSIDKIELETIPGVAPDEDATVFVSHTFNGRLYGKEWRQLYGDNNEYDQRFYIRRWGYVRDYIGLKFRGASRSRMAFANLDLEAS